MSDKEEEGGIVEKPGRKPYNKNIPRLARGEYENRETPGYVSWQSKINVGPNNEIDEDILEAYLSESSYEEVEQKDADKLPSGSRIAYIRKDNNKWCSGGYLSKIEESYEDADGKKFKRPKLYIIYKAYNNSPFCVQLEDIDQLYVMKPKMDNVIIEKPYYLKKPKIRTNFPVRIDDEDGYEVVVYYAKDNFDRDRFKSTRKYKNAAENPERWLFEDNTQEPSVRE